MGQSALSLSLSILVIEYSDDEQQWGDVYDNTANKKNDDQTKELLRVLDEHAASSHPWDDGVVALRRLMLSSSSSSNNNSNNNVTELCLNLLF